MGSLSSKITNKGNLLSSNKVSNTSDSACSFLFICIGIDFFVIFFGSKILNVVLIVPMLLDQNVVSLLALSCRSTKINFHWG